VGTFAHYWQEIKKTVKEKCISVDL